MIVNVGLSLSLSPLASGAGWPQQFELRLGRSRAERKVMSPIAAMAKRNRALDAAVRHVGLLCERWVSATTDMSEIVAPLLDSFLERDQLVFGKRRQHEVLEVNFLGLVVRVQLQSDRSFVLRVGLGIAPIDDLHAVDDQAHAVALREDLQVVPIVLLADLLGRLAVDLQSVAAVTDRTCPSRWETSPGGRR